MKKISAIIVSLVLIISIAWFVLRSQEPEIAVEDQLAQVQQESRSESVPSEESASNDVDSEEDKASSRIEIASASSEDSETEHSSETINLTSDETHNNDLIQTEFPNTEVIDAEGNTVQLHSLLDKPTIINVWASWCPPCREEMPYFQAQYDQHHEDINFIMLNATGSRPTETKEEADAFLAEFDYTFPIYYDPNFSNQFQLGVTSLPSTYIIEADGKASRIIGMVPESTLETIVQTILND